MMRRLFVETAQQRLTISGDDASHLLYAMRAKPGQLLELSDRTGACAKAKIVECLPQAVIVETISAWSKGADSTGKITLVQALPKASKMEFIVQKAVELGVSTIIPVQTANCVVKYDADKCCKRQLKWQKVAEEAAKQCGRSSLATVAPICSLAEFLRTASTDASCKFVCYEREEETYLREVLQASTATDYLFFVGPEGGFDAAEIAACQAAGLQPVSLGKRILRLETVPLAVLAILQYEKGDLGKGVNS